MGKWEHWIDDDEEGRTEKVERIPTSHREKEKRLKKSSPKHNPRPDKQEKN